MSPAEAPRLPSAALRCAVPPRAGGGAGAGVSCGGAATSLRCVGICRSSATGGSAGVSCCGAVASFCCVICAGAEVADWLSVKGCSGVPSAADGTATAFDSGEAATQGMPRRDKQLRSSCHQSCCWHAAGGSEISALATSSSSRASGYNASTPTTLANATREADATKRKFEYKAHLLRSEFRPPNLAQKQRRCGGTMSVQGARSSGTWNRA
jgi:hypothetical protein